MSRIDPGVESRRIKAELDQIHAEIQTLSAKLGKLSKLVEGAEVASGAAQ
ncbi:MAG: hypothetical protein M9921_08550 [Fimbriimonadaceae bacterium]|nr:hypothetical protein [Chthonomonadaceae bacterium]MCO5296893.1 hypothetical protein [Fimbriimonadaceae bacterium]